MTWNTFNLDFSDIVNYKIFIVQGGGNSYAKDENPSRSCKAF